jgi:hypothetical protein
MAHRYVVFAERARGFDTLESAREFALANVPAVVCERVRRGASTQLVEIARNDFLFDEARGEWRVMFAES